jgi:hypothetical protein
MDHRFFRLVIKHAIAASGALLVFADLRFPRQAP